MNHKYITPQSWNFGVFKVQKLLKLGYSKEESVSYIAGHYNYDPRELIKQMTVNKYN